MVIPASCSVDALETHTYSGFTCKNSLQSFPPILSLGITFCWSTTYIFFYKMHKKNICGCMRQRVWVDMQGTVTEQPLFVPIVKNNKLIDPILSMGA